MKNISFKNIELKDCFWEKKQNMNKNITIYAVRDRFMESGRFEAFKCNWKEGMENQPHFFWDSDVAKWIEGAAYIISKTGDTQLQSWVDEVVDDIEKNMEDNGYFNIYFTVVEPENRFKRRTDHELYCAGHLMEAAVAYYEATGKDKFLKLMCRYADLIEKVFKIEDSAPFTTPGHEEIELALVRLYHCTKEKRYLELAKYFIDMRGNNDKDKTEIYDFAYESNNQSHVPVRLQYSVEGHSVRACYLYAAMADIAYEYNDEEMLEACKKLFFDITQRKMYITGGVGQSHAGEAFTIPYDLPNIHAYAETCAAISLAMFATRMNKCEIDSKYGDVVEKVLYNGIISGISLDGDKFFYENPLEINPYLAKKDVSMKEEHRVRFPITQRVKSFWCSCCPPNINRFFASVGDYIYTKSDDTYFINQYIANEMVNGDDKIEIITDYPVKNIVAIKTNVPKIAFRIPGWCKSFNVNKSYFVKNGYAYVDNTDGEIVIDFNMKPVLISSNPKVGENAGRVALMYGPIVYCLEEVDSGKNLRNITISPDLKADVQYDGLFSGNIIFTKGYSPKQRDELYFEYSNEKEEIDLKFIPYYGFANRGESEMLVWVGVE